MPNAFPSVFAASKGHPFETGFDLTLRPERIKQPLRWRRPQLVFVNSMSDLFHKNIPTEYIARVFDTMERADWHIYQVLTKRSSLMRDFVHQHYRGQAAPPHIWLGVSIENAAAMTRLRHLKQTNASVRFVSFEPLLGPLGAVNLEGIHWIIAGGESGPGVRPMQIEWVRALRDQCQAQRVAFFFKQWGGRTPKTGGNTLDGRQWLEYPRVESEQQLGMPLQVAGVPKDDANDVPDVGPWAREKTEACSVESSATRCFYRRFTAQRKPCLSLARSCRARSRRRASCHCNRISARGAPMKIHILADHLSKGQAPRGLYFTSLPIDEIQRVF